MNQRKKIDMLNKNRLLAIESMYRSLVDTISVAEISTNNRLRWEIYRIWNQLQMTKEVNKSFDY